MGEAAMPMSPERGKAKLGEGSNTRAERRATVATAFMGVLLMRGSSVMPEGMRNKLASRGTLRKP
jgi:hypothetical protein